jgi:hypothetical protein
MHIELKDYENIVQNFINWKNNLRKEMIGGKLMFDVPKYYKWLEETELLDYYLKHIK